MVVRMRLGGECGARNTHAYSGIGRHGPAGAPSFIFAPYNAATQGIIRASFHYTLAPGTPSPTPWFSPTRPLRNRRSGFGRPTRTTLSSVAHWRYETMAIR